LVAGRSKQTSGAALLVLSVLFAVSIGMGIGRRLLETRAKFEVRAAGFPRLCFSGLMPDDFSDQDIRLSLARAFDRAWDRYYRSGRLTVSRDIARTELARRLVQLSKDGVRDENSLCIAGLNHLHDLTLKGGKIER
jgi:hypothetical protein